MRIIACELRRSFLHTGGNRRRPQNIREFKIVDYDLHNMFLVSKIICVIFTERLRCARNNSDCIHDYLSYL